MDQSSFDRLARVLGGATNRRSGLKAAFAALLGAAGAAAAPDAEAGKRGNRVRKEESRPGAGKRQKTCKPACGSGFECVKQGRRRVCVCPTGIECGGACCLVGQACDNDTCVPEPEPVTCIAFGEPCKNVGKRCCDGLACGSGQDGSFPVACWKAAGSACASTAECSFGNECTSGTCTAVVPPDVPTCTAEGGACASDADCCPGVACGDAGACGGVVLDCTIKRSRFASDELAGAALKELVEAGTGASKITVGPGVYKPVPGTGQFAGLVIGRDLTLQACDPANKPILDGGAAVTKTAGGGAPGDVDNAKDLTWTGGSRILLVPANLTVTVDGVHFRNGNAADSSNTYGRAGGAVHSKGALTLKNLEVRRSRAQGDGGGVAAVDATGTLVLNDVDILQSRGDYGGAVRAEKSPLTYAGSAARKAKVQHNYAESGNGGISYTSQFGNSRSGQTTATLQHLDVSSNASNGWTGGIEVFDLLGYVSAEISDVDVLNNSARSVGGVLTQVGLKDSSDGTYPGKATLTRVQIKSNTATSTSFGQGFGGGLANAGKLQFGASVDISGNRSNHGSGVHNSVATANVTCATQAVSGNTASDGTTAAASGQGYADCFGSNSTALTTPDVANLMPAGCCATNTCTTVVCGGVCCANSGACTGGGFTCP